jgi:hypothetical protein
MIDRRSLLSWLGVSVTGALDPRFGKAAQRPQVSGLVALESFYVGHAEQMPQLYTYLGGVVLPLMKEIQHRPGICLESIVARQSPQALVLTTFCSFDEMLATRGRVAADRSIQNRRAELEAAGVLLEVQSQVLVATQERLEFPLDSDRLKAGIFEIRSYQCSNWHANPPTGITAVLNRAGIYPIVNAASAAGEHMPQFTYVIPFESLATRHEAWSRLAADPDWIAIERQSERHGSCVKVTAKSIYKLAPYSQLA